MKGVITLLGTAGSLGIPVIGCRCKVCVCSERHNQRKRPCNLIQIEDKNYLLDAGPDVREQALKHHIYHVDGLILTHTHFDHVAGLDDLRVYSFLSNQPLPIVCSRKSKEELMSLFSYLFQENVKQKFTFFTLEDNTAQDALTHLKFSYAFYEQIGMQVTGYRFGDLSYVTDIKHYNKSLLDLIAGSKTLVIGALEWNPTRAHLGLHEVIAIAKEAGVSSCVVTHIGHELDHYETNENLPSFVQLAYDGMSLEFTL